MSERAARAHWIARWILPAEPALRTWLNRKLAGGQLDVDDIVQECYAVLGELRGVEHIRSPRNYLFQTAQSIVIAHYRRSKIAPIDINGDLALRDVADPTPSPEAEAIGRQELLRLRTILAALPPRQREAFRLLKLEGLSYRAASAQMGISVSTLEKHVAKALITLMRRLADGGLIPSQTSRDELSSERDDDSGAMRGGQWH